MSIDSDLKRIADALEKIAILNVSSFTSAPVDPAITLGPPTISMPTTTEELKALAQKTATGLPEGALGGFTDYVRATICARYGVKKLIEIPKEAIPAAATDIMNYKP